MTYKQALDWIYGLEGRGIKLGLSNIERLLRFFGEPHISYPVVLIAGTNGKGSVASFISNIMKEAGLKVGLYTSPHLITMRERFAVFDKSGEKHIPRRKVADIAGKLKESISNVFDKPPYSAPTYFEILTAMAFIYFRDEKIDFGVFEVGLGGRLDATNVSSPVLSIITNIGLEHTDYLGKTLSLIAREKAGIIRDNTPLVTGCCGEALDAILEIAKGKNAPVYVYGRDFLVSGFSDAGVYQKTDINGINGIYPDILLSLRGKWQSINAALAIAAAEVLSERFPVKKKHIYKGLKQARWPGRFEIIGKCPVFILDGAHNPHAAGMLKEEITRLRSSSYSGQARKITMLFGVLKDKNRKEIMEALFPFADEVILLGPKMDRAVPPDILLKEGKKYNKNISAGKNLPSVIKEIKKTYSENDIVLVCGSLYLVGEARSILLGEKQE